MIRPRGLREGSRIALVAPAGPLPEGAIERAVERVRSFGWEPVVGPHAHRREGYLAGSDEERLADLQAALDGDNDAIWCLRGGYGTLRIVDRIDFGALVARPRPLIGFSDNTVLHLAALRAGITTFHGPHAGVRDFPAFTRDCLRRVLSGNGPVGVLPRSAVHAEPTTIRGGAVEGPLVGGNLSLLAATVGTSLQLSARSAILFLEDVGEPAYRIDRLLTQLLLSGVLADVVGVAVGALSDCPDDDPALPSPQDVVRDRLHDLGVPVVCGLSFGHTADTWTLPLGVGARLDADRGTLELLEPAVAG